MGNTIEKLQRVPLREVWKHEAYDFTQWLQENLDILNDTLDLDLTSAEREQAAGSFSIDLVAENNDGQTVIIENQLEKSNHDHLGKLITYLTAREATGAIWIVSDPRQEHINAISWLNESTNAYFYLVKVEAVRIGASSPAPLLTLIAGPSNEAKVAGKAKQEIVERHYIRKRWWTQLLSNSKAKSHQHISPNMRAYICVSAGYRGLEFNYLVGQNNCGCELYIDRGKDSQEENKMIFDKLQIQQNIINEKINYQLSWQKLDNKRASRIRIDLEGGYKSSEDDWSSFHENMIDAMNQLEAAIKPELKKLKI